jgi:hypothetical protein
MSCHSRIIPATVVTVLLFACGKSTSNSDSALGSGGTSSSVDGDGGGRGGSGSVDADTTETVTSGGRGGTSSSGGTSGATATSSSGGTGGGVTTTSSLDATSTTGNEGGASASGGATGMTAEEMGCIVTGAGECRDQAGLAFACPLELPTPDTCSECYEPTIDEQGHPINQCTAILPSGDSCKGCCCDPTRAGCEERESISGCAAYPDMPRYLVCVTPYEEPSGCTPRLRSSQLDTYCCP